MKFDNAFPSKYLKVADLQGRRVVLAIDYVQMETIGHDNKLVCYFAGKQKGLTLNKTNAKVIAEIAGTDETDNWRGVKIELFTALVEYQGKRVDAIRVDWPAEAKPSQQAGDGSGLDF